MGDVPGGEGRRKILVVANETVGGATLRETIGERARGRETSVLVVCPALNSRLKHWLSDVDDALALANGRLASSLAALAEMGIDAQGRVGDADPVQAIVDALQTFSADEIIISTHPRGRSNWLEKSVVERAGNRVDVPITHVVVDLARERSAPAGVGARPAGSADAPS